MAASGAIGNGKALCLEGGGFLAITSFTGIVAGLLNVVGKMQGKSKPTLASTALLGEYGTISSVSGGSWFMEQLAYSESFRALVEDMAADPKAAAELFNARWVAPWVDAFAAADSGSRRALNALAGLLTQAWAQDVVLIAHLWRGGLTWQHFMDDLMRSTAGIDPSTQLGSPVQDWASGKVWLCCHSMVTPSDGTTGVLWQGLSGGTRYSLSQPHAQYVPAKVSITLGQGTVQRAPAEYCVDASIDSESTFVWESSGGGGGSSWMSFPCWAQEEAKTATSEPVGRFASLTEWAGKLPLNSVVGCSSAFLGGFVLSSVAGGAVGHLKTLLRGSFPVWASSAPDGAAFSAGAALVEELRENGPADADALGRLAKAGLRACIDGANTDNTGIAHAVACGAKEVTAFMVNITSLFDLCQGGAREGFQAGVPLLFYEIFAESRREVRAKVEAFKTLSMPGGIQVLRAISYGSLALTTLQNDAFGVAGGRTVELLVVNVESTLSIGIGVDFKQYGVLMGLLVQEFTEALSMPENSEAASALAGRMMQA